MGVDLSDRVTRAHGRQLALISPLEPSEAPVLWEDGEDELSASDDMELDKDEGHLSTPSSSPLSSVDAHDDYEPVKKAIPRKPLFSTGCLPLNKGAKTARGTKLSVVEFERDTCEDRPEAPTVAPPVDLHPLTVPQPSCPAVKTLSLHTKANSTASKTETEVLTYSRADLNRMRQEDRAHLRKLGRTRPVTAGDGHSEGQSPVTIAEGAWRKWEEVGGIAAGLGELARYAYDQQGRPYKPEMSYILMIRLVLASHPRTTMTLSQIYQAIESRWPYFQAAGSTWRNSVRHNLSLNDCFENIERPVTEGGNGKGGYWRVAEEPHRRKSSGARLRTDRTLPPPDLARHRRLRTPRRPRPSTDHPRRTGSTATMERPPSSHPYTITPRPYPAYPVTHQTTAHPTAYRIHPAYPHEPAPRITRQPTRRPTYDATGCFPPRTYPSHVPAPGSTDALIVPQKPTQMGSAEIGYLASHGIYPLTRSSPKRHVDQTGSSASAPVPYWMNAASAFDASEGHGSSEEDPSPMLPPISDLLRGRR